MVTGLVPLAPPGKLSKQRGRQMQQIEIRVKGQLNTEWMDWFADLEIAYGDGDETILRGAVADQSAFYGLVARLRDLGLDVISVNLSSRDDPADSTR